MDYFEALEIVTAGELPPLPYNPFNESVFEKLPTRSKTIFRILHRLIRTEIQKNQGYRDIGIDVIKALLKVLEDPKLLQHGRVKGVDDHISKVVVSLLDKEKGLPKLFGDDRNQLTSDVESAISDYERSSLPADKPETPAPGERFVHFGPSLKTLTVAPVHVPWNHNLKFPNFIMSEFPGVQKSAHGVESGDLPLPDFQAYDELDRRKRPFSRKKSRPKKKNLQTSPPIIIYSRGRKSYRPIVLNKVSPHMGLGRRIHQILLSKIQRGNEKKLKAFLEKYQIPHEKISIPSVYDKVIIQYLTGPWKDRKNPTKPFRVTVFVHGVIIADDAFSSQNNAEKFVKSGIILILKNLQKNRNIDLIEFNYNKQKFTLYPGKIRRILAVLDHGKRFRLHRFDGDYLIYRGEHPQVRNDWVTRKDIANLNQKKSDLESQIARQTRKMESAQTGSKLQYRPLLIKLKRELIGVETDLEKIKTEAKDIRYTSGQVAPMAIKRLNGFIKLVSINA